MHNGLCELLHIEYPIIQAGMGIFTSAELVAAVSNAGGLGSLGVGVRSSDDLKLELIRIRELTDRPFAMKYVFIDVNEEIFSTILELKLSVISFALGDPGDLRMEIITAMKQNRMEEFVPWAGQTVGLIDAILPAADIVWNIASASEEALHRVHR